MNFLTLMEKMRKEGCIVGLRLGPYGWSCDVMDPDLAGINVSRRETPDQAVQDAHAKWSAEYAALNPEVA